ncbi:DegT/DnrJ/EryC1/StrS family aminotransferase [Candidatus Pelagibacter sp.]|jgi:dTDP-3-amino-2,3,6-trideoxy-4-keto-D-glucose/dTDP-3-amino-3,4,6-trideoxy-alpha-D-glucose/dTDP-2,6-dideoxy-D-kanosamine transaminase|nr:DegT/DnrJ/EryC1/StrS family aminotransferase [Candidatus Pelagibacter sp.]|tara:strand:- start:89 stop:1213 length:1125 start_codon:yes stop_codon:yes gene_type:complete
MIKVWDYLKEYKELRTEILDAVDQVFKNGTLIFGPKLEEFENKFSKYNDCEYGIGVGNCTDAITIALKACGVGYGDEVITTSNTAVPTVTAIVNAGATVKFVDIDKYSLMDVTKLSGTISKKTKAIVPVHLFGQMCDMKVIMKIAKEKNLKVIEDCAQSHGATYNGEKAGSIGDVGCYSFYPTKIFGAYGDGGFITTNNEKLFDKMRRIRFLGMEKKKMSSGHWNGKYYAVEHGMNSRLDEVHAAILLKKLPYLDKWITRRREIAKRYNEELKNLDLELPLEHANNKHAYYIYVVGHKNRDKIMSDLEKKDIHLNISYPWPIHKMDAYKHFVCSECTCLPKTEEQAKKIFSLPMYPTLEDEEQETVIRELKKLI